MMMLVALFSWLLQTTAPAQTAAAPLEMITYQMVLLREGKPVTPSPEMEKMQAAHLAFLAKLNQDRVNLLYGPFLDTSNPRGIVLLDVRDAEAAKQALGDEPFIKAGYMTMEVKPWLGPKGWFHPPTEPPTPENLILGVLMRGPTRSASTEEAEALQKGHLAYMESLAQQGKLVAAGPFLDNTDMRGIVIYRGVSLEEAKALAAGDPSVKAGRLVLDARPWMTFKGILK